MSNNKQFGEAARRRLWVGACALLTVVVGAAGIVLHESGRNAERRARASTVATEMTSQVDRQLSHGLSATYALASLVRLGDGRVAHFDKVAAELLPHYPGVSSLQLAPAGVIRQIAPLSGNEPAIGHDLLADQRRNKEALRAVETRRLTLAGPFTLIQGGDAVVGRLPVFLGKPDDSFWGFTIAVIGLGDFLAATDLQDLAARGYAYELWRRHPDSGERQVFARSAAALPADPVSAALEVPNGEWILELAPAGGWRDWPWLAGEALALLCAAMLAGLGMRWYLLTRQRLAESEIRYRSLYESTPTMMHSINADGVIVSVSQAWLDTLGYRREAVIGRKSLDFLTPGSRQDAVERVLPEFFRNGHCHDVDYQMVAGDGRILDVLLSAYGERDAEGRIVRSLAVIQDVTERRRTERQLHRLLAEQKAIIENDLVGIVRVRERVIVWANPAFATMLGYAPGELNGAPTRQNYPDQAAYETFGNLCYPVLRAGGVFRGQIEQRHRDGRVVWLNISGTILDRDSGESLWAFVDISELKYALSRVARSEQRMELALAGASLAMWDWHLASGTFVCDARMHELLGYAPGDVQLDNAGYTALINLSDLPGLRRSLGRHLKGETEMFEAEYRVRHHDEHWVWILCRGRVIERDRAGRAVRMTGTKLDISERKRNEEIIRSREARLANLLTAMQDLVIVFDAGGSVLEYFYPPEGRHPGRDPADPRGGRYVDLLPPETAASLAEAMGRIVLDGRPTSCEYVLPVDGGELLALASFSPILDEAAAVPCGFLAVVRDITTERMRQRQIDELSRRNTLLLESVGEGIFGVDLAGRATFVNSAALDLLGLAEAAVIGHPLAAFCRPQRANGEPTPAAECPVVLTLQDGACRYTDGECFQRRDGHVFPVSLNVAPVVENARVIGAVVVFQDITERRQTEEAIRQLAFYDPLTQLPNRRLLYDRLERALAASRRSGLPGALFFVDLDAFKALNDRLGHSAGDLLLQQVATRLLGCVRESDTVARIGGDEFVLLCERLECAPEDAGHHVECIGNKILAALNEPYRLGEVACRSTCSIGVALFTGEPAQQAEDLLREADSAMYQAKAAGRNALHLFRRPAGTVN
ncbi:MAG TPA: PAS domain S-box protein [Azonexus sp.]